MLEGRLEAILAQRKEVQRETFDRRRRYNQEVRETLKLGSFFTPISRTQNCPKPLTPNNQGARPIIALCYNTIVAGGIARPTTPQGFRGQPVYFRGYLCMDCGWPAAGDSLSARQSQPSNHTKHRISTLLCTYLSSLIGITLMGVIYGVARLY